MKEFKEKVSRVPNEPIIKYLGGELDSLQRGVPIYRAMSGEAFEKDHWAALFRLLGLPPSQQLKDLKTGSLLDCLDGVLLSEKEIRDLVARAQGELTLREALEELVKWCAEREFELGVHSSESKPLPLVREWKDLSTQVSDNISLATSLRDSRFAAKFQEEIDRFVERFSTLDQILLLLGQVQRRWVYLEPVFFKGALPAELPRFRRVDDDFRALMLSVEREKKAAYLAELPGLAESLEGMIEQLDRCQKALNDFL